MSEKDIEYVPHVSEESDPDQVIFFEDENGEMVETTVGEMIKKEEEDDQDEEEFMK